MQLLEALTRYDISFDAELHGSLKSYLEKVVIAYNKKYETDHDPEQSVQAYFRHDLKNEAPATLVPKKTYIIKALPRFTIQPKHIKQDGYYRQFEKPSKRQHYQRA